MPPDPRVSIVVLSYNRPRYLERALASVTAQTHGPAEILLVDNQSAASAEIAAIAGRFPGVTLIANQRNTGFTGGMNLGLQHASEPWVLLTEDDLVLEPGCVAALVAHAQEDSPAGVLSGIMIDDARGTILSAGGRVHLRGVYRHELPARGEPHDPERFTGAFDVDYIPGALMFARRDLWRRFGGFREDFFAYGEDSDFCLRVRRSGVRLTVVPTARARHLPPADAVSDLIAYHQLKNFFALYLLHAPPWTWPEVLGRYVVLAFLRANSAERSRLLRAVGWTLRNAFALLRDRGRERPANAGLA